MKIKNKLVIGSSAIAFLSISVVSVAIYWIAVESSQKTVENLARSQLVSIRDATKSNLEGYFDTIRKQVLTFSNDLMVVEAMKDFSESFSDFPSQSKLASVEEMSRSLDEYYSDSFQTEYIIRNASAKADIAAITATLDDEAIALQYSYISMNRNPLGSKHLLNHAGDDSKYSQQHAQYHPHFRYFLEHFGYYDIFLVDSKSGKIVYSVFKELDFGTSLIDGPYAESGIARAFNEANGKSGSEAVAMTDFSPYTPSYEDPAAFIASPIYAGKEKVGILIFQMPIDRINAVMTHQRNWSDVGLGESGETYLVGADYNMRSMSRFLIEDPVGYLQLMKSVGLDSDTIESLYSKQTSIGLQPVRTTGTQSALSGVTGFEIFPDYRGVSVLSAYAPLRIEGLNWVIMSEIDEAEAFAPIHSLVVDIAQTALVVGFVALIFFATLGWIFANNISKLLGRTVAMLKDVAQGESDLTQRLDESSKDELGEMAQWFNVFVSQLQKLFIEVNVSIDALSSLSKKLSGITDDADSGLQQQRNQTAKVVVGIKEILTDVCQVATNASDAATAANDANRQVTEGHQLVENNISVTTELAEKMNEAGLAIDQLEADGEKIGGVLSVIQDVAEQTNLLALNAAIEAARAGEMGRGFAVVADEVRNLASRTKKSIKEIEALIERLQKGTQDVVGVMKSSKENVQLVVEHANLTGKSLTEIRESINAINEMNTSIAHATENQNTMTAQISATIEGVSKVTELNAKGVSQTSSESERLKLLAVDLQKTVGQFKTA